MSVIHVYNKFAIVGTHVPTQPHGYRSKEILDD
jgi:hypothetical protein